ncbi:MAG: serine/threonine-protein phosphatase [Planctomycetaceae bacterium]|nr:serine/threonine-protein phosphatase [Planctomycetaceae bacterium]
MSEPTPNPEIDVKSPDSLQPTPVVRPLSVQSFGMTDRGLVRAANEDQFLIAELTKAMKIEQCSLPQPPTKYADDQGHIFVVADGLGGAPAGEEASVLVVKSIEDFLVNTLKWFFQLKGFEKESVVLEFQDALRRADAKIFAEVAQHPELAGMGTTLTLAYSLGENLFVANAGDSRCYLFRHNQLTQLTSDHTLAQDLVRQGMPALKPGDHLVGGELLTNAIGGHEPGVRAEVYKTNLEPNDVLLLATDGLTSCVPDDRIAATLQAEPDPKIACERLVAQSLEHGGLDNVTVIVARYESPTG